MKILIISNYFPPHFKGGYEISCKEVADFLHEKGEEIFVLCGDYQKDKDEGRKKYRVNRKLQYIDYLSKDYWNKSKVEKANYAITKRVLNKFQPDFVYFWNLQYISLAPYWAVKRAKIPHLFDIGDVWPLKYKRSGFKEKIKSYIKILLPNFLEAEMKIDPVVILSEWMRPVFKDMFSAKKIYTIPRGVKLKENIEIISDPNLVKFMFAGRIEPLKGLDLIIKVLSKLTNYNWILDVYGDGEEDYLKEIELMCKEFSLEERVNFKGKVYPLDSAYESHDVFLFPTLAKEGFGRVAIEAMNFGLPVVTVDRYGPNDIVINGVNGFKCSPDNLTCWENSLKQILSDNSLLIKMSNNALKHVKDNYDIELINKKRYDLIKELYYSK